MTDINSQNCTVWPRYVRNCVWSFQFCLHYINKFISALGPVRWSWHNHMIASLPLRCWDMAYMNTACCTISLYSLTWHKKSKQRVWVRLRMYGYLVTSFCYQLIANQVTRQPHLRDLSHKFRAKLSWIITNAKPCMTLPLPILHIPQPLQVRWMFDS